MIQAWGEGVPASPGLVKGQGSVPLGRPMPALSSAEPSGPTYGIGFTPVEGMEKEDKSIHGSEPKCPKGAKGIEGEKASRMKKMRSQVQTVTLQHRVEE